MEDIFKIFKELEEFIKINKIYKRCRYYDTTCIQCEFWKRFDLLKKDIVEGL